MPMFCRFFAVWTSVLPPGTLDGHRTRFNSQFIALKDFYINSSNLQYFKNLIQVPLLPNVRSQAIWLMNTIMLKGNFLQNPPNFLRQADLRDYVSPIVRVQNDESPEGSEAGADTALIDVSIPRNSTVRLPDRSSVCSRPSLALSAFIFQSIPHDVKLLHAFPFLKLFYPISGPFFRFLSSLKSTCSLFERKQPAVSAY